MLPIHQSPWRRSIVVAERACIRPSCRLRSPLCHRRRLRAGCRPARHAAPGPGPPDGLDARRLDRLLRAGARPATARPRRRGRDDGGGRRGPRRARRGAGRGARRPPRGPVPLRAAVRGPPRPRAGGQAAGRHADADRGRSRTTACASRSTCAIPTTTGSSSMPTGRARAGRRRAGPASGSRSSRSRWTCRRSCAPSTARRRARTRARDSWWATSTCTSATSSGRWLLSRRARLRARWPTSAPRRSSRRAAITTTSASTSGSGTTSRRGRRGPRACGSGRCCSPIARRGRRGARPHRRGGPRRPSAPRDGFLVRDPWETAVVFRVG